MQRVAVETQVVFIASWNRANSDNWE